MEELSMNRRSFAALLPALAAGLPALAEQNGLAQTGPASGTAVEPIETGMYPGFTPPAEFTGRKGHSFFHGMLPTDIGCEAHVSYLAVGAQHEPLEKHKHSEIWLVREGKVELMLDGTSHILAAGDAGIAVAGTMHWVRNAGDTVASYFVLEVGTGALGH
jgi:mannose-6-phosphate isomerase-like protein (cupin superfamily)